MLGEPAAYRCGSCEVSAKELGNARVDLDNRPFLSAVAMSFGTHENVRAPGKRDTEYRAFGRAVMPFFVQGMHSDSLYPYPLSGYLPVRESSRLGPIR